MLYQVFSGHASCVKLRNVRFAIDMSAPAGDDSFVLEQIKREMPELADRTVIVSSTPCSAADFTGGVAIIGKSGLEPMTRCLVPEETR